MAAFPNTLSSESNLVRKSAVRFSRAVDGTPRYIDLGAATYYQLNGVVEGLSESARDTLITWFDTNETSEIDFTINGTTYRGRLMPDEDIQWEAEDPVVFTVTFAAWVKAI